MTRLTKRLVDEAGPKVKGDAFTWDADVKGFGLKVSAAGGKTYVLQYRNAQGRSRRISIGRHGSPWTCEEARGRALELLRELASGRDPLDARAEARAPMTVDELADAYLADGPAFKPDKKASSWATDRSNIDRHVRPLLGRRAVMALTRADFVRFQADVTAGKTSKDVRTGFRGRAIVSGGKGTAGRTLAVLAAMMAFAVGRGWLPENPAKGVKPARGERRERFMSRAEVAALADALAAMEEDRSLDPRMANAIRLLMLTGARKSEVLKLRWREVDLERGLLRLADSKTGAKTIALASPAAEVLAGLSRDGEHVLPAIRGRGHVVGLQKAWERVRARAGLDGLRLHDLRHSFASFAVADGASLYLVGKVLGHRQARTTEVYAHLRDDPVRAVAERAAATVAKALRSGKA